MENFEERIVGRLRDAQALAKLVGSSGAFRRAIATLPAVARSDATVLITGETGTGKELVARTLHYLSGRAAYPFVPVNCGSVSDVLLEDDLFGHERGAFTDARCRRPGLLAQAARGTLFLDEVDTLTDRGQIALLRVLQDRRFRPIGSDEEREAQVRFVAATNAPLRTLVERGAFRADLYYRLCVFALDLPPLRERREDILDLATHFFDKHAPGGAAGFTLSPAAQDALLRCSWPGNIRELENAVIRAIHVCDGRSVEADDLGLGGPRTGTSPGSDVPSGAYRALKKQVLDVFERDYLTRLMRDTDGNVTRAARLAGKERRDLGKLLKKHSLDPRLFRRRSLAPTGGTAPGRG